MSKEKCKFMLASNKENQFGWHVVSGVYRMNEVNARWAQLALRWVTVFGRVYQLGM